MRRSAGLREQAELALYFPLTNIKGMEIDPFAVQLARVTLWMGHKLAVYELDLEERVLPLVDLSGIRRGDALKLEWPRADAIIGNPPYHGSQRLRGELGDEYVEWLRTEFGIGVKDYAVYSISQNRNRAPSLHWIVENGGVITSAVSTQDWSGEAAVDVSIVNWVKDVAADGFVLDGLRVSGITPALRDVSSDVSGAVRLAWNQGKAFQGPMPVGAGFIVPTSMAKKFLDEHPRYSVVVRPYLVGDDIANRPDHAPSRYVIDFGVMTLEEASQFPEALSMLRMTVKAEREQNADRFRRTHWWLLGRPVLAMRKALKPLTRYVAGIAQGKRIFFVWQPPRVCPSNLTNVFAFDDDQAIGVLSSTIHHEWARAQSSTLEDRFRYTPTSAFETFPWPLGDLSQVGDIARHLDQRRSEICLERQIGLTKLYNEVDDGAYRDLRELHEELDEAVAAAYGWPASAAHDAQESNRLLLELNRAIAAGEIEYHPFE
jgi:MmeI, DNA-methyltransferase domain/MmeI, target recognition domain